MMEKMMRTVSVFKNGNNQAVRLPKDMEFEDVSELEIIKIGEVITLRPIRPSWQSLSTLPQADADFLQDRPTVIGDEGRFEL
jgi:antitoxin VapB